MLGLRSWDLSYAIYRFVPFVDFEGPDDGFGDFNNRLNRLKKFFEAYGASREEMIESVKLLPRRLLSLLDWMYKEAAAGNEGCKQNLQDKHLELYLRDIRTGDSNPCRNLIHGRERCRLQERVSDACNDRAVLLRGGPHCEPLRINNKRVPFRLAFGETLPRK